MLREIVTAAPLKEDSMRLQKDKDTSILEILWPDFRLSHLAKLFFYVMPS